MTAQDKPVSKPSSDEYRTNWEAIFGKKDEPMDAYDQLEYLERKQDYAGSE